MSLIFSFISLLLLTSLHVLHRYISQFPLSRCLAIVVTSIRVLRMFVALFFIMLFVNRDDVSSCAALLDVSGPQVSLLLFFFVSCDNVDLGYLPYFKCRLVWTSDPRLSGGRTCPHNLDLCFSLLARTCLSTCLLTISFCVSYVFFFNSSLSCGFPCISLVLIPCLLFLCYPRLGVLDTREFTSFFSFHCTC